METEANYDEFLSDFKESSELQKLSYSKIETKSNFETFIKDTFDKNKIDNSVEFITLEKKLQKIESSIFNENINENKVFRLGLILFLIFFIFRYLMYGTKWSLKQLKK